MHKSLVNLLLLTSIYSCSQKIDRGESSYKIIDSIITAENKLDNFHGSIVISKNNKITYQKHLGIANRSLNTFISSDTKFDIASLNKSFISALILIAIEEGKLRLKDKLIDKLNNFSFKSSFNPEIDIHVMSYFWFT